MEKYYNCEKQFMYRMPLTEANPEVTEEFLLGLCSDEVFLEKVRIASPGLYESMRQLAEDVEGISAKRRKEVLTSVYKYYIRSAYRTTPFGLFSGVGVGSFEKEGDLLEVQHTTEKHILPDAKWLYGYIETLEKAYLKELDWKVTGAAVHDGNRITLLYTNEEAADEKSIRNTRVFEIVESKAKRYSSYDALVQAIRSQYLDVGDEVIERYLHELVEHHILVSSLRPSLEERQPFAYLLEACKTYGVGDVAALEEIWATMQAYVHADAGRGMEFYDTLQEKMRAVYPCEECVQVDCILQDDGTHLNYEIKTQVEEFANFLSALATKSSIDYRVIEQYRNRFLEKYGEDREVPVLELLDATVGIGAPYGYLNPWDYQSEKSIDYHTDDKVRKYLSMLYEEAVEHGGNIQLEDAGLQELLTDTKAYEAYDSFDLYFHLAQKDGDYRLYYNASGGSPIAGATLGRFSVHDDRIRNLLGDVQNHVAREGEKTCEIQFLPQDTRNGNVCRSCTHRDYVMGPWVDAQREVRIEDVVVGVWNQRFYAKNVRTGEILRFGSSNMFNKLMYPNVYRFLLEICNDGAYTWYDYPWDRLFKDFPYVPAIYYKDICVMRANWHLSKECLQLSGKKLSPESFAKAYEGYAAEHHIPSVIQLVEADNKMRLDTTTPWGQKILYDLVKKSSDQEVIIEAYEEESLIMGDGAHTMEIVTNMTKRKKLMTEIQVPERISVAREKYQKKPLEQWLYFKVYCKQSREEELITMELHPFAKKLEETYGLHHFFMRYVDTRTHLRIRFGGEPEKLYGAMPKILNWLNEMMELRLVGDYTISVYEQETERYGGEHMIPLAEQLFVADSHVVEQLLLQRRLGNSKLDAFTMTVISILRYTQEFFPTVEEQVDFLERFHTMKHQPAFKQDKERFMALCDIQQNWHSFARGDEGWMMKVMDYRTPAIRRYQKLLDGAGYQRKKEILYSVLHLHCNRMLGINREEEARAMCYAEGILHSKKYQMMQATEVIA